MYAFIFTSQVELGFRVRLWYKDNSLNYNSFPAEKVLKILYFRNCSYTNMKAPFSLLALFTRREGNPGAVER